MDNRNRKVIFDIYRDLDKAKPKQRPITKMAHPSSGKSGSKPIPSKIYDAITYMASPTSGKSGAEGIPSAGPRGTCVGANPLSMPPGIGDIMTMMGVHTSGKSAYEPIGPMVMTNMAIGTSGKSGFRPLPPDAMTRMAVSTSGKSGSEQMGIQGYSDSKFASFSTTDFSQPSAHNFEDLQNKSNQDVSNWRKSMNKK